MKKTVVSFDCCKQILHRVIELNDQSFPQELKKSRTDSILIDVSMASHNFTTNICSYVLPQAEPQSTSLVKLSKDFESMFEDKRFSDVTLKVNGHTMAAHRVVLCSRSPVFARMFENPMQEETEKIVDIPDVSFETMKKMVAFLYTGVVFMEEFDAAYEMFYAADKYEILDLRNICSGVLLSKITTDNACRLFALASRHSDEQLKKKAASFIQFHFTDIAGSDSWDDFVKDETKLSAELVKLCSLLLKKE